MVSPRPLFPPICRHLEALLGTSASARRAIVMYTQQPPRPAAEVPWIPGRSHVSGGPLASRKRSSDNGAGKGLANDPKVAGAAGYDAEDITVLEGLEAVR